MENKFILVPSDLYKNLLKPNSGEINVENAKTNLNSLLNKKKLNTSTKNLLYNQELQRFLKLRKEIEDKPVKVQLTDGSLMVFNPKQRVHNRKIQTQLISPTEKEEESEGGSMPIFDDPYETAEESDSEQTTPKARPLRVSTRNIQQKNKMLLVKKKQRILSIISEDRDKFGINPKGNILRNDGTPYLKSNVNQVLERILRRSPENAPSPIGTRALEQRLRNDPRTKELLKPTYMNKQSGSGYKKQRKFIIKKWI